MSHQSALDELPVPSPYAQRQPAPKITGLGMVTWLCFRSLLNPVNMMFSFGLPVLMYLIFGVGQEYGDYPLAHGNVTGSILITMALYGAIVGGSSSAVNISLEKTAGWTRQIALTPLSPTAYIFAKVWAGLLMSTLIVAVTFLVGALTGAEMSALAWSQSLLIIVLSSGTIAAMFGLAAGLLARSDAAYAVTGGGSAVLAFISGMFLPLESMGDLFQKMAPFTPLWGANKIAAVPINGWETFQGRYLLNVAVWIIIFALLAIWGQRRSTTR